MKNTNLERGRHATTSFVTVSEAAKYMGVGKQIIYQLIEFGEVRAVRERGAIRVERRSLDEFRSSGKLT